MATGSSLLSGRAAPFAAKAEQTNYWPVGLPEHNRLAKFYVRDKYIKVILHIC
jgi:hypothetical protein